MRKRYSQKFIKGVYENDVKHPNKQIAANKMLALGFRHSLMIGNLTIKGCLEY